jgi:hypothetical protein
VEERTWLLRSEVLTSVLGKIMVFRDMVLHLFHVGEGYCLGSSPEIMKKNCSSHLNNLVASRAVQY